MPIKDLGESKTKAILSVSGASLEFEVWKPQNAVTVLCLPTRLCKRLKAKHY